MKSSSQFIEEAEAGVKLCFRQFDVKSSAIRATYSPPSETDSLAGLISKSSQIDPKAEHTKLEKEFSEGIKSALGKIDEGLEIALDFERAADYLDGKSSVPPGDDTIRFFCDQAKAAAQVGGLDLLALASDIRRNIAGAKAELERLKADKGWVDRTRSASIVAIRSKRYLLSHFSGFPDAPLQEARLKASQTVHDRKFGVSKRRTDLTGARV